MKKLISAVTSLCVAATMVSAVAPISSGAAGSKALALKAYDGAATTIDCSNEDVIVPIGIYFSEDTADTNSIAAAVTVTSGPDIAKISIDHAYDPSEAFYSAEQTFTKADGSEFTTDKAPAWAGSFSRAGKYQGAKGSYNGILTADGVSTLGVEHAYVAGGWINSSNGYDWTGATSDAFPYLVFTVKFPKGTADGEYNLDFVTAGADAAHPANQATLVESSDGTKYCDYNGNLSLSGITITVGAGGPTESSTTATTTALQNTTTTTTATTPDGDYDILVDLGNYEVPSGGGEVVMEVKIDSQGNPMTAISAFMKVDDGVNYDGMEEASEVYGAIVVNDAQMKWNLTTLNGTAATTCSYDDGAVATIYWVVPDTTPDGEYKVSFDKFEVRNDSTIYNVGILNGVIKVGEGETESSTTTSATTTSSKTTTTTTTTTTVPVSTTTAKPGEVLYGDANCDGVVNVADVVVLNKWRNDNTSYPLTDQGKINADCFNAKGGKEITEEDSLAILQSIVHLITLPATSLAD